MAHGETIVRELIRKIVEENQWKQIDLDITEILFDGRNYSSSLFTIILTTDKEILKLFGKVGKIVGEMRKQLSADWFYEVERMVYKKLIKIYEHLQDKHNIPDEYRLVFPKCYGFHTDTVLMENLLVKGFKEWNRFDCMDWEHAALSMEILAKFHALSFAYAKEYPEEFEDFASKAVYKTVSIDNRDEKSDEFWKQIIENRLDVLNEECKAKLKPIVLDENFIYKFHKPIGKPVLVHGDYKLNNILFRRQGSTLEGIPVDFQLLHSGCLAEDLIFFIFLGSDEEFRKQYYYKLLDHYYEHLCQALRRLDVDPVETYPRETFDEHMQKMLQYAVFVGVFLLPLIVMDSESIPKPDERSALEFYIMEPNDLYITRFQGIINDYFRLSAV